MEEKEYQVMFQIEDNYWWYLGLRNLTFSCIKSYTSNKNRLILLDAGCGTGKLLESCNDYKNFGLDYSEEAIKFCKRRKLENLVNGSICNIPYKENTFDIVISLDVLYHAKVENDVKTLQELYYTTKSNGLLMLNLPAYNFLQSRHDKAIHTRRRYTAKELKGKLEKAGFKIERITYRNSILFPLAVIKRITERIFFMKTGEAKSDLKPLPYLLNKLFTSVLNLENRLIMSGVNFPFGLSLFCIAKKKMK